MTKRLRLAILAGVVCGLVMLSYWWRLSWAAPPGLTVEAVYTVSGQVVGLQVREGYLDYAEQTPYRPQGGDRRLHNENKPHRPIWLQRQGQVIGSLVGPEENILYGFDRFLGKALEPDWADEPSHYQLSSPDDPNYRTPQTPRQVWRKSKPSDRGETGRGQVVWPLIHSLYLEFPTALQPDKTYELNFLDQPLSQQLPRQRWRYRPLNQWSEAVHVSQIGFHPEDPVKVAFLSVWLGNGGGLDYADRLPFSVIDERTNQLVYDGQAQLSRAKTAPEDARDRNYTLADVYELRFDALRKPGRYRVCVASVGCSDPFAIADDVWQQALETSLQGFYYQRSGIELATSSMPRPRPFHPDDMPIYQSRTSLLETNMGIGEQKVFDALAVTGTKERVADAWGGYFDAGDWDRRIQHLEVTRLFLELWELFPEQLETIALNIPESRNGLPDFLDEALWTLDFFQRLQLSNGGIRGGIESVAHPKRGEASWQNSLPTYVYAPDPWSSYLYAGTAAQAAWVLQDLAPRRAADYRETAIAAMDYAERQPLSQQANRPFQLDDARNLAAVQLYRLTGETQYHEIFLATTVFEQPDVFPQVWGKHHQTDAAFCYARLPAAQADRLVQANARAALLKDGDRAVRIGRQTAFHWSKDDPYQPLGWAGSLGTPKTVHLLRAHALSRKNKYLRAAIAAAQFSAGANPSNLAYTTGLGNRNPQHPLVIDTRVMGEAPPPGITVYGPLDPVRFSHYWMFKQLQPHVFPDIDQWPTAEAYFDIFLFPAVTEFTVMRTMAPTAYTWGYLGAVNR
ncbi:MAG: glycoside hydrolase family 9 protein [Cyanobacteria bacterium P01_G01_bin.54]